MFGIHFNGTRRAVAALAVAFGLSACGAGGGSSTPSIVPSGSSPTSTFAVPKMPSSFSVSKSPSFATPKLPANTSRVLRPSGAHPPFFSGEAALNNGVYYLNMPNGNPFGYYSYLSTPNYIYHFDIGYLYYVDASDGAGGIYFYDFSSGHWWYTNRTWPFPYLYDFSLNALLFEYADTNNAGHYTTNPRYFYDFGLNQIITLPGPSSSTKNAGVSGSAPASAITFDAIGNGIGATFTLPATVDSTGTQPGGSATMSATLATTPPNGVPALNISGSTPIAYVTVSASATIYFGKTPTVSLRPAGSVPAYGYLAMYSSNNWVAAAGATTLVNNRYTMASTDVLFPIVPGTPMTFAVFGTSALVSTLAPPGNADACFSVAEIVTGVGRLPKRVTRPASAYIVSNRLYVTRQADTRTASAVHTLSTRTVSLGGSNGLIHEAITLPAGMDAKTATAQLRATAGVVDVQPIHRRFLSGDAEANDSWLDNDHEWYLYKTNVDTGVIGGGAWGITHGSGIKVAVIDTGVDQTNQDLQPKLDKTESVVGGMITSSAQDTNGHGTNVNGLVAAQPNNGYGFAGTGWDVHLLAYKIFPDATTTTDCQGADTADEATAINDAVSNGASVISLSLGSPNSSGPDAAEQTAVEGAIAAGVTVVAADGNEYTGSPPDYPAAYAGVIAVGASSVTNSTQDSYSSITAENVASYSNDSPTLVAPGGDAFSDPAGYIDYLHWITGYGTTTATLPGDQCTMSQGFCIVLFNGTSQATPQVSGAIALMMAKHGGARSLTPAQVKTILTSTAYFIPGVPASRQGAGRLDVLAAVNGS